MNLFFFDTETTGLDPDDRIIQFCGMEHGGLPITGFFNPDKKIKIGAMAIHHITQDMIKNSMEFSEIVPELNKKMENFVFIAHNAKFDIDRLKFEGCKEPKFYIDTLKVAQSVLQWSENEPENYKLQYLRYFLDLKFDQKINPHDAESDVIVLENLFFKLLDIYTKKTGYDSKKTIAEFINISKNPVELRRIPFGKHQGKEFKNIEKGYIKWLSSQIYAKPDGFSDDLKFTIYNLIKNEKTIS